MTPDNKSDPRWIPSRDTVLDLSVNIVPLVILVAFSLLFLAANPWGWDPLIVFFTHFLTLLPLVLLAVVSYVAGIRIQHEDEREEAEAEDGEERAEAKAKREEAEAEAEREGTEDG